MPETRNLQDLARALREYAGETGMSEYAQMMLRAARDLETFTTGRDHPASRETAHSAPGK